MKILSVANVATLLGGTGACAHDCIKALPECSHEMVFVNSGNGPVKQQLIQDFGCPVFRGADQVENRIAEFKPDLILWHNSDPARMPREKRCRWVYYHHSGYLNSKKAAARCDVSFVVSRWLANGLKIDAEKVLYQPVELPALDKNYRARDDSRRHTIGRIATPTNHRKWKAGELIPEYKLLAENLPEFRFEFVGCPDRLKQPLADACQGRAKFFPASRDARQHFHHWGYLLYRSSLSETYGRTICEAQMAGCLPIVSPHSGLAEQVESGVTGWHSGSPQETLMVLRRVEKPLYERISEEATHSAGWRSDLGYWRRRFLERALPNAQSENKATN